MTHQIILNNLFQYNNFALGKTDHLSCTQILKFSLSLLPDDDF